MYVAVLANLKTNAPKINVPAQSAGEPDSEDTINAIQTALQSAGHQTIFIEADKNFIRKVLQEKPDICFNIAEGYYGDSRESQVPAILEMYQIPYTGSKILPHAISLDKPLTKRVWSSFRLRTAPFQVFKKANDKLQPDLHFPLFVKPSHEGSGIGIVGQSLVENTEDLRERVTSILEQFAQPALVEPFLAGREFTVGVIGNQPQQYVFPPIEVDTRQAKLEKNGIYTKSVKAEIEDVSTYLLLPKLKPTFLKQLQALALSAHNAIGALDTSRVDIRCDEKGVPYLLEINTSPGLNPGISDLPFVVQKMGLEYSWLINTILNLACERYGMKTPSIKLPR